MINITFTPEQSAAIVAKWNEVADARHQLTAGQAHLIPGDNFEDDIDVLGEHQVEIRGLHTASGNPATFYIFRKDVTVESVSDDNF